MAKRTFWKRDRRGRFASGSSSDKGLQSGYKGRSQLGTTAKLSAGDQASIRSALVSTAKFKGKKPPSERKIQRRFAQTERAERRRIRKVTRAASRKQR